MSGCGEVSDCHSDSTPPMRSALGVELRQFPVRILASCLRRGLHAGGVCLFTRVLYVLHETSVHTCVTRSHFTRNQQKGGSPRPKCTLFFFMWFCSTNEKNPPSRALSATRRLKWPCAAGRFEWPLFPFEPHLPLPL